MWTAGLWKGAVFPRRRTQQRRVPAAGKGRLHQRELDSGGRAAGGGQHGDGAETRDGGAFSPLQTRTVHSLEPAVPQGESKSSALVTKKKKKSWFKIFYAGKDLQLQSWLISLHSLFYAIWLQFRRNK